MIKNIIFDFDGVILDSVPVKTEAFRELFKEYDTQYVDTFVEYHLLNGGVSRYKKIDYFFEMIVKMPILKEDILVWADKYSELTLEKLKDSQYIIKDTVDFIKQNSDKFHMHIASGADEKDLLQICLAQSIHPFFISIHGSPTVKTEVVENIMTTYGYKEKETILIGDSINDFDAAFANHIAFYGYNNRKLLELDKCTYIYTMSEIEKINQTS